MRYDFVFRNLIRSILITVMAFGATTLVQAEKNPSTDSGSSSSGSSKKEQKSGDQSKTTQSKKQGNSAQAQDNYTYGKDQTADYWKAQGISAHTYGKDAASDYWISQGKTPAGSTQRGSAGGDQVLPKVITIETARSLAFIGLSSGRSVPQGYV